MKTKEPRCPSCGKAHINHPGLAATCSENLRLKAIIKKARSEGAQNKSYQSVLFNMMNILAEAE